MLSPLLLAQVFSYCTGNPLYDAPNGSVVQFQQTAEMVHIDHSWVNDWVEVLPTDGRGNLIFDSQQSYGMRIDGCGGQEVGV